MKKVWRKMLDAKKWKNGAQTVSGVGKKWGSQITSTKLMVNPVRSVSVKLFLLIMSGILACVLLLGLFSYNRSSSVIQSKVADANVQMAEQTAGKLSLLLANYERQSMQFITDNEFMNLLSRVSLTNDDYEKFDLSRQLAERLTRVTMADSSLEAISLIPLDESLQFITTGSSNDYQNMLKLSYMEKVKEGSGKAVWIPTQVGGMDGSRPAPTLGVGRVLNQGKPVILLLEIKLKSLAEEMQRVKFGDGGSAYILSNDGYIVYAEDISKIATKYEYPIPDGSDTITIDGVKSLSSAGSISSNGWTLIGNTPVSELVKDAKQIRSLTIIISIVAIFIAAAIGVIVIFTVGRPLGQLRTLMNEGEKGNLTVRSSIRKKDEIGQVAESFNRMMEEITSLVRKTNQSAQEVLETAVALTEASRKTASAAKEIAIATEEIANGATNLAVESERGSDLTGQIGVQVQSVIHANSEMGQAAGEVEEASQRGSEYMNTLIVKTGQTEEMTRSMVEKVDKLKESTGSIRKILDVMGNVSKQTNILSLNATIEAARAGAAGKGFMVVADEIRKLADQSRQSIGVVGEIVETIQREIEETVSVLSEAYPIFKEQIESVREANEIFVAVQENMNGFINRLESATDSVRNLEEAQSTLTLAMTNVSAVAQEASATSEEVASLSNEQLSISDGLVQLSNKLESVSNELRESLARFTVN
jgi:methyl-accepting chemotaxis protein